MSTNPRTSPKSKHIAIKYHCFRQHTGKEFVIRTIDPDNHKSDIFTKSLQGELFARIKKFICRWQAFRQEGAYQIMSYSLLNGDIMVQKGVFWTIR